MSKPLCTVIVIGIFWVPIVFASGDAPFPAHCNTCDVGIEFYTQRIDKQVFDLSARLKSLSERHGSSLDVLMKRQ